MKLQKHPDEDRHTNAESPQSHGGAFVEFVKIALIALLIVLPIRFFVIQPFFVRGASMEPTFHDGEYLIIDEISYRLGEPERGDVIVFRFPLQPRQFYIKRIVGLPGETVEITNDGSLRIVSDQRPFGTPLAELLPEENGLVTQARPHDQQSLTLEDDEYFVLGDNREASSDSRRWGALPERFIVGRAWLRLWPVDRASILTH